VGRDKNKPVQDFPEPVGEVARKYLNDDLDLTTAAAELFIRDPQKLASRIEASETLKRIGLGALASKDGHVKRGAWESVRGFSQMQQAAAELGYSAFSP
jgi:hypothetical protein